MKTIDVFENETLVLDQYADVELLRRLLGGCLERRETGWAITRFVGHVRLRSGDVLRIRSRKASSAAIVAWMAYADPLLRGVKVLDVLPESADEGDAGALLAKIFLLELARALAHHGLRRRYRRERSEAATVRGAIDFARLARRGGDLSRVPCVAWQRVAETPLNQLLAGGVRSIALDPMLSDACRDQLPRARAALTDVTPLSVAPPTPIPLSRNEEGFASAARLAQAVLRHSRLGDAGTNTGASFLVNVEALFERTLSIAFRDAGLPFEAKAPVRYRVTRARGPEAGTMEMDLYCMTVPPIVVDAKYKDHVNAANLQQLVTYCFVSGAPRAAAVVPRGSGSAGLSFEFRSGAGDGRPIAIDVVDLDTSGRSVAEWRANALSAVSRIVGAASSSVRRESHRSAG